MPVETERNGTCGHRHDRAWRLVAGPALPTGVSISPDDLQRMINHMQNTLPSLQPILSDVLQRFKDRLEMLRPSQPNEVYLQAAMDLVPGFCGHLYKKWNGRLAGLFAEDARDTAHAFLLNYVFALDDAH